MLAGQVTSGLAARPLEKATEERIKYAIQTRNQRLIVMVNLTNKPMMVV